MTQKNNMLYLIRHSQVLVHNVCYGQSDIPVRPACEKTIEKIKQQLPTPSMSIIFSSPQKRCISLCEKLFPQQQIIFDNRIQEMNFGDWEQKSWDEIPRNQLDEWAEDIETFTPPRGESYRALHARCQSFYHLISQYPNPIIAVTHAGVIRALKSTCTGLPIKELLSESIAYCSVTALPKLVAPQKEFD